MASSPILGIPLPNSGGTDQVPADMLTAFSNAETFMVGRFANASARDAKITSPVDGMLAYMLDDEHLWVYDGTNKLWTWPKAARGQLARADFTDTTNSSTNYMTPLSNSVASLPAFNVSVSSLPANRHVEVSFRGQIMSDAANTAYGFVMNFAGVQHRGVVQIPIASSTGTPIAQNFNMTFRFDTTAASSPATGGISAAGRFTGTGNCYLVAPQNTADSPIQFAVTDMGGV